MLYINISFASQVLFLITEQWRKVNKVLNFQHFFGTAGPVCVVKFDEMPQIVSDASAGRISQQGAQQKRNRVGRTHREKKSQQRLSPAHSRQT
jgi:hypothetical protein